MKKFILVMVFLSSLMAEKTDDVNVKKNIDFSKFNDDFDSKKGSLTPEFVQQLNDANEQSKPKINTYIERGKSGEKITHIEGSHTFNINDTDVTFEFKGDDDKNKIGEDGYIRRK